VYLGEKEAVPSQQKQKPLLSQVLFYTLFMCHISPFDGRHPTPEELIATKKSYHVLIVWLF